jgi:hypothetical protein
MLRGEQSERREVYQARCGSTSGGGSRRLSSGSSVSSRHIAERGHRWAKNGMKLYD